MFTKRIMIGTILTVVLTVPALSLLKTVAARHAIEDPEHTWPAKIGRAFVGTL
jgi:hypothetical protein